MSLIPLTRRPQSLPMKGHDVEHAVDGAIEHYVSGIERQYGLDDDFVKYMKSTRRTAAVLPFPQSL
jgi:hypothetical protein